MEKLEKEKRISKVKIKKLVFIEFFLINMTASISAHTRRWFICLLHVYAHTRKLCHCADIRLSFDNT